jgi:hypothetical protein
MILNQSQYENAKFNHKINVSCDYCFKLLERVKRNLYNNLKRNQLKTYCNQKCQSFARTKAVLVFCLQCNKEFSKKSCELRNTSNSFCSNTCSASYNNLGISRNTNPALMKSQMSGNWIRQKARYVLKNSKRECLICGYNKILEVCHIKPVSDFLSTDLVSDINKINNLAYLCPNHHKELDKNLLSIKDKEILDSKLVPLESSTSQSLTGEAF